MFTADQKTILAIIVLVYFLFLVLLAYTINRRVKTYEDYSVAGRSVSVFPMILTLVGTAVGGATLLGYIANGYVLGMGQLWLGLVIVVPSIVIVTFMAGPTRRLGQHHNMVTLGDFTTVPGGTPAKDRPSKR